MDMLEFQNKLCRQAEKGGVVFMGPPVGGGDVIEAPGSGHVAALAPHPDDPDAVAATLALFAESGCRVTYIVVCSGIGGVTDSYAIAYAAKQGLPAPADLARCKTDLRRKEQTASARLAGFLDTDPLFLELEEDRMGNLIDSPGNARAVGEALLNAGPDLVVLPHGEDTNTGHLLVHRFFRQAARAIAAAAGKPMTGLYNRDPKTLRITEHLAVPFGPGRAEWKAALLRTHDSQHARNLESRGHGLDERILRVNREAWERLQGKASAPWRDLCQYAETFQVECFR